MAEALAAVEAALPVLGPIGMLRWAWTQLTSMRTALFLLLLLAVAAVPGSLFPQRPANPFVVTQYIKDNPEYGELLDTLQLYDVYSSAWFSAIYILLFISLNFFVGVFNLLPLLPLDGGHITFSIIEGLRGRSIGREVNDTPEIQINQDRPIFLPLAPSPIIHPDVVNRGRAGPVCRFLLSNATQHGVITGIHG